MKPPAKARRTGGRSARVRAAVIKATMEELAQAGVTGLSVGAIAARAGVHPTSIYRRWKTVEMLALDAALNAADTNVPVPDTGSLRQDLIAFLTALDAHVRSSLGTALLALSGFDIPDGAALRDRFWKERFAKMGVILERAVERGEIGMPADPDLALELLIAPIYLRALILRRPKDDGAIERQVETAVRAMTGKP